ncbi:MAG: nucleotidyltransferase domain-containing protein [Nitrospirae bacterium]|nr:nucleotidyltransferase domain-containing protein [Nitrospirota bacterium]
MDSREIIQHILDAVPDVVAVYQFGSTARGQARPESDVDLAVLARSPIQSQRRFEIEQELANRLHRDVDLVDLQAASTVMRMQVLSTGHCLESRNDLARRLFEMYAYSDYARLNEERQEILKQIKARGSVYG